MRAEAIQRGGRGTEALALLVRSAPPPWSLFFSSCARERASYATRRWLAGWLMREAAKDSNSCLLAACACMREGVSAQMQPRDIFSSLPHILAATTYMREAESFRIPALYSWLHFFGHSIHRRRPTPFLSSARTKLCAGSNAVFPYMLLKMLEFLAIRRYRHHHVFNRSQYPSRTTSVAKLTGCAWAKEGSNGRKPSVII